jgi:hypothetical protein
MKPDAPESKKASVSLRDFSPMIWFALIAGTVVAIASYILVFFPKSSWMRSSYLFDIEHDSIGAFCRRFLLGAAGGAIIGLLHAIREIRDKKKEKKDDA